VSKVIEIFVLAQSLLNHLRRDARLQRQRRTGVPQAVELDLPDLRNLDQPRELAGVGQSAHFERRAQRRARRLRSEDEVEVEIRLAVPHFQRGLRRLVDAQQAKRPRRDDGGQLDICDEGIFYEGSKRLTVPWGKVLAVSLSGRSLIVHRTTGGEPYDFEVGSVAHARLAHTVALAVLQQSAVTGSAPRKSSSRRNTPRSEETNRRETDAPVGSSIELPGYRGIFSVQVVGESHCQAALRALGGDRRLRDEHVIFTAALVPDPKNEYHPDAIKIYISGGSRVGTCPTKTLWNTARSPRSCRHVTPSACVGRGLSGVRPQNPASVSPLTWPIRRRY
jgi:hypothetical protein